MVIGFIAGLGTRVLAAYDSGHACNHEHHDCSGHDGSHSGHDHQHDDKCPPDHHHQCGTCLHTLPLGIESDVFHRLAVPGSSRSALRDESEWPPDGPFQALDKPPLI